MENSSTIDDRERNGSNPILRAAERRNESNGDTYNRCQTLIGKILAYYSALNVEPPFGIRACKDLSVLRKHLKVVESKSNTTSVSEVSTLLKRGRNKMTNSQVRSVLGDMRRKAFLEARERRNQMREVKEQKEVNGASLTRSTEQQDTKTTILDDKEAEHCYDFKPSSAEVSNVLQQGEENGTFLEEAEGEYVYFADCPRKNAYEYMLKKAEEGHHIQQSKSTSSTADQNQDSLAAKRQAKPSGHTVQMASLFVNQAIEKINFDMEWPIDATEAAALMRVICASRYYHNMDSKGWKNWFKADGDAAVEIMDKDNDGKISQDEFFLFIIRHPMILGPLYRIEALFHELDVDHDGHISHEEMATLVNSVVRFDKRSPKHNEILNKKKVQFLYKKYAKQNKKLGLNFFELAACVIAEPALLVSLCGVKAMFHEFDEDGDGYISGDEARNLLNAIELTVTSDSSTTKHESLVELLNRNNGRITLHDFSRFLLNPDGPCHLLQTLVTFNQINSYEGSFVSEVDKTRAAKKRKFDDLSKPSTNHTVCKICDAPLTQQCGITRYGFHYCGDSCMQKHQSSQEYNQTKRRIDHLSAQFQ
eukprot:g2691.t1